MPCQEVGKPFPDMVLVPELVFEERSTKSHSVPWNEGQIGIGTAYLSTNIP